MSTKKRKQFESKGLATSMDRTVSLFYEYSEKEILPIKFQNRLDTIISKIHSLQCDIEEWAYN